VSSNFSKAFPWSAFNRPLKSETKKGFSLAKSQSGFSNIFLRFTLVGLKLGLILPNLIEVVFIELLYGVTYRNTAQGNWNYENHWFGKFEGKSGSLGSSVFRAI